MSGSSSRLQSSLLRRRATSEGGTLGDTAVVAATSDSKATSDGSGVGLSISMNALEVVGGVYDLEKVVGLDRVFALSRGCEVVSSGDWRYYIRNMNIKRRRLGLRSCSTVTD